MDMLVAVFGDSSSKKRRVGAGGKPLNMTPRAFDTLFGGGKKPQQVRASAKKSR